MLTRLTDIEGFSINATDKVDLGTLTTCYFDDHGWIVRYFVVDTGSWLSHRHVLISPVEAGEPDMDEGVIPVELKMQAIQQAPEADLEQPVSRQHEEALAEHYNWTPYWAALAEDIETGVKGAERERAELMAERQQQGDPNLRDVDEVTGYTVSAQGEEVGHVADFVAETDTWIIRYLLVETGTWLAGRSVIVSPHWAEWIDWPSREVQLELSPEEIEQSPEYNSGEMVERDYEITLHEHYGREAYWE